MLLGGVSLTNSFLSFEPYFHTFIGTPRRALMFRACKYGLRAQTQPCRRKLRGSGGGQARSGSCIVLAYLLFFPAQSLRMTPAPFQKIL